MPSLEIHSQLITNLELRGEVARSRWSMLLVPVMVILACVLLVATGSRADSLDLAITSTELSTMPGGTVVFTGVITNTTGTDLDTTELFLNFSGFDPTNLNVN